MTDGSRRLMVIALGGNAISPPRGDLSLATERAIVQRAIAEIAPLVRDKTRLLIVHGNGPQVGRLLTVSGVGDAESLDIHVAQTQGEIGYLIAESLDEQLGTDACVTLLTRVLVDAADPAFSNPTKPVGAVLDRKPEGVAAVRVAGGWRRVVPSPRPLAVIEQSAIAALLGAHHVIAGGGGGIALTRGERGRVARPAVIDKDYVAALLAIRLNAERLLFVTDVAHAFDGFGTNQPQPITRMSVAEARARLHKGAFAPGSMAPKIESAIEFVAATRRPAIVTTLGSIDAACRSEAGTTIE
ncbi:MAG TPA: carbamate kinase [Candidatus Binatia bacterium]|nr:carbamate kinase [Candidatus Binatia bacterium]